MLLHEIIDLSVSDFLTEFFKPRAPGKIKLSSMGKGGWIDEHGAPLKLTKDAGTHRKLLNANSGALFGERPEKMKWVDYNDAYKMAYEHAMVRVAISGRDIGFDGNEHRLKYVFKNHIDMTNLIGKRKFDSITIDIVNPATGHPTQGKTKAYNMPVDRIAFMEWLES